MSRGNRTAAARGSRMTPGIRDEDRPSEARETVSSALPSTIRTPDTTGAELDAAWVLAAREFHLSGERIGPAGAPRPPQPFVPAVLIALGSDRAPWRSYPVVTRSGGANPLLRDLEESTRTVAGSGGDVAIVAAHLDRLARAFEEAVRAEGGRARGSAVLDAAFARFRDGLDVSAFGAEALRDQLEAVGGDLKPRLDDAVLLTLDGRSALRLLALAVRAERGPRRAALVAEVRELVARLEDLLRLDDRLSDRGRAPAALGSVLGQIGQTFVDPDHLAKNLPPSRGPAGLGSERRARIEATLGTLSSCLEGDVGGVGLIVVRHEAGVGPDEEDVLRVVDDPNPYATAVGLFDEEARSAAALHRALRVARLEVDGAYDPELHDRALARFQWQAMTPDELLTLPSVVVLDTERRLRGSALAGFSELLRSGRPVHVLVEQGIADLREGDTWEALAGYHPGLGYVSVAHREAFVLESSLARVDHLASGLRRIACAPRPGVALVATPTWDAPVAPWLQLIAAHEGRSIPSFSYDPDAGPHWAERFDLSDNPQIDRSWPEHAIRVEGPGESASESAEPFTFAHAAALDPEFASHFLVVPSDAWSEEQIEIAEYLVAPWGAASRRIPFVRVVGSDGVLARAIVTRELAFACRDRLRAWKILQELAGTDNEYARRAAERARREALDEAARERAELEAAHAEDLARARREAAGEAIDRLVQVLLGVGAGPPLPRAMPAPQALPPRSEAAAAPVQAEAQPEAAEEAEAAVFTEPYIDSVLCTSCQDCININARMFKYDANKQAFIADAAAGTFDELVRAAEKCPARCIHPGAPRQGDATVTDDLVARAARFN